MSNRNIEHVFVLMLENRSFDHMLGMLKGNIPELEGVPTGADLMNIKGCDSVHRTRTIWPSAGALPQVLRGDPRHDFEDMWLQLYSNAPLGYADPTFSPDFVCSYANALTHDRIHDEPENIMRCYATGDLPALHTLAQQFAVCDHWFCSVPAKTWPNRFFLHAGTSAGLVEHRFMRCDHTLFHLMGRGNWRVYHHAMPQLLAIPNFWDDYIDGERMRPFENFARDLSDAERQRSELPHYILIEPASLLGPRNDQHPPQCTCRGEQLIADVYNAIRCNPGIWRKSVLFILYDESGGIYDHVDPPTSLPSADPSRIPVPWVISSYGEQSQTTGFQFNRLGPRVPAVIVSPWVRPNSVIKSPLDHTSLGATVCDLFGAWTNRVRQNRRMSQTNRLTELLNTMYDPDVLPKLVTKPCRCEMSDEQIMVTDNQRDMLAVAERLRVYDRLRSTVKSFDSEQRLVDLESVQDLSHETGTFYSWNQHQVNEYVAEIEAEMGH